VRFGFQVLKHLEAGGRSDLCECFHVVVFLSGLRPDMGQAGTVPSRTAPGTEYISCRRSG